MKLGGLGRDCMLWKYPGSNQFSDKSNYSVLAARQHFYFPWSIWRVYVPSKVVFFIWTAALEKILTADNLRWKCLCARRVENRLIIYFFIVKRPTKLIFLEEHLEGFCAL